MSSSGSDSSQMETVQDMVFRVGVGSSYNDGSKYLCADAIED